VAQRGKVGGGGTLQGGVTRLDKERTGFTFEVQIRIPYVEVVPSLNSRGQVTRLNVYRRVYRDEVRHIWAFDDKPVFAPLQRCGNASGKSGEVHSRPARGCVGAKHHLSAVAAGNPG